MFETASALTQATGRVCTGKSEGTNKQEIAQDESSSAACLDSDSIVETRQPAFIHKHQGRGKIAGTMEMCPRKREGTRESRPVTPHTRAPRAPVPGCIRSFVYQTAKPSPCRFFFPCPWILKCTCSSQSLRKQG